MPYCEGALDQSYAQAIATHLERCSACADELALIRSASNAIIDAKESAGEPAGDLWERIEREIRTPARSSVGRLSRLQVGGALAAAAILLFAAVNLNKLDGITSQRASKLKSLRPVDTLAGGAPQPPPEKFAGGIEVKKFPLRPQPAGSSQLSPPPAQTTRAAQDQQVGDFKVVETSGAKVIEPAPPIPSEPALQPASPESRTATEALPEKPVAPPSMRGIGSLESGYAGAPGPSDSGMPGPSGPAGQPPPAQPAVRDAGIHENEARKVGTDEDALRKRPAADKADGRETAAAGGNKTKTLDTFKKDLEADPTSDLSRLLNDAEKAGVLDELQSYYKARSSEVDDPAPLLILAKIYEHRRDYRSAIEIKRTIVRRHPRNQRYLILLGDCLLKNGQSAEARTVYYRAASITDDESLQKTAKERLRSVK